MSVDILLSNLNKVRKTGPNKWAACCPAHDDRGPSLAVRELDDGRVLLHCFAGCEPEQILAAVGLTFDALFPERLAGDSLKRERRPFNAADVLRCLSFEAVLIIQYANEIARGEPLSEKRKQRLLTAASRFQRGLEVANA
ncbi:CHC2 zinc finger domain-containing protein [Noviherbaspirillum galbum]|uniref:DNA primase n=1 Tax=Noviherbaspirillum galbum TaxID=2709383 RepID=A0A6B3SSL5_9BURK|nr:CHC2 zinc finger domain-containing protein [Noviherbaspirillum galbum]NEX63458.1 DNA primase [Noviherbaspirillum galbum]